MTFPLLSAFLGIVLSLGVLEGVARLLGPEYYQFNNNSSEYYTNPRGYHDIIRMDEDKPVYGIRYNENKLGMRLAPGVSRDGADKDQEACNVLALGDSFTYGKGVRYEEIFTVRLEHLMAQAGRPFRVKNAGVPGADVEGICNIYSWATVDKRYPLVIYGFVLNDLGLPGKEKIVGADLIDQNNNGYIFSPWRQRIAAWNLVCHARDVIRLHRVTIRAYQRAFELENAGPKLEYLDKIAGSIRASGGRFVLVLFPLLYDFDHYPFKQCHQFIHDYAKHHNIEVLDLLPAFSRFRAEDLWVNPTDHHPNEIAHRIAAQELFRLLTRDDPGPPKILAPESAAPVNPS